MYEKRFYRDYIKSEDYIYYQVKLEESDLFIASKVDLSKQALKSLKKYRYTIEKYGEENPGFLTSLVPIKDDKKAPTIIKNMMAASMTTNVGPMASVAGAISDGVGMDLLKHCDEIIIENGGDIFLKSKTKRKILVYAGHSPFSGKIALAIEPDDKPLGICTSAGTIGHSLSFGKADAVVVISENIYLADAMATAIGNIVKTSKDINKGIDYGKLVPDIRGILIIIGDKMGAWGTINIVQP